MRVRESEGEREREVTTLNGDNKHSGKRMFRYSQHCYFPPRRTLVHLCADYMQQNLKKEINFLSHACSAPIDCTVLMHKLHVFKDHLLVVWSEWVARVLLAILINRCRFTSLCVILPTQRFNWLLTLGFMITWSSYQKNKNKRKKRESDPPVSHSTSHLNQTQQWDLCCKIDAVVLHFTGTAFQMHLFVVSACFFLFCFFNMA